MFFQQRMITSLLTMVLCALSLTVTAQTTQAVNVPNILSGKTIRLLIGFPAGGTSDSIGRSIAEKIGPILQANVIVENKPGANGNIAAAEVARSAPDGLTLYLGSLNNPVNQAAERKLPFDFVRDFAPVALVTHAPNVLIVTKKLPAQNIEELIALAKKEPGKLSFASAGAGSSLHMAGELFNYMAQVNMVHVPYKGSTPAMADLMGGHIEMMFDNLPTAIAQIKANNVRALGITGSTRVAALPDIPTIAEAGIPGFNVSSYFALFTPTGTPTAVIDALNAATNQALAMPELKEKFAQQGASPAPGTPKDLGDLTMSEIKKWAVVLKAANIKFD